MSKENSIKNQIGFSDEFSYDNLPIKYMVTTEGNLGLYVEDCALALGVTQTKSTKSGTSTTVRWERVYGDLVSIEKIPNVGDFKNLTKEQKKDIRDDMKSMTISERELYLWSFRVGSEQGKKFRDWLATTVLPNLRQYGIYITGMENMNAEEIKLAVEERSEAFILRKFGIGIRRELTDAIKEVLEPKPHEGYIYAEYTNMVYNILFDMDCKEYKKKRGLSENDSLRDDMKDKGEVELLNQITKAEDFMGSLLRAGMTDKVMMKSMMTNWFDSYKTKELIK